MLVTASLLSACEHRKSQTLYEWTADGDDWWWRKCSTPSTASVQTTDAINNTSTLCHCDEFTTGL